jgi:glycosyl transferase family 87
VSDRWHRLLDHIRTGDWITPARVRAYSFIMLGLALAILGAWIISSDGLIDRNGKPVGTDFSNVYAAGTLVLHGHAADAYEPVLQHAAERAVFERDVPFFGWHYPPFFFAIAALVATVPYAFGLLLWMALSLPAYLATIRAILPRPETLLAATAFPAVFVNTGHGQNGFFTAALLGGALQVMERRPALAGVLIGLLAYKPQFGLLIPLALLASKRWITLATAAATVVVSIVLSVIILGTDVWLAFRTSTAFTQSVVLEQGGTGWEKIQSMFSAVRMWGASIPLAYGAQSALTLAVAGCIVWLWRIAAAFELKAAALALACLLATPYVLDYDLVVLGVAIAFLARHGFARGFHRYEATVLAVAWIMPLLARTIMSATGLPLGLLTLVAVFTITMMRAISDTRAKQVLPGNFAAVHHFTSF